MEKLLSNIRQRGREYEKDIGAEYLEKLQKGYFEYLRSLTGQRILILDVNELDFVGKEQDYLSIERTIFDGEYGIGLNRMQLR